MQSRESRMGLHDEDELKIEEESKMVLPSTGSVSEDTQKGGDEEDDEQDSEGDDEDAYEALIRSRRSGKTFRISVYLMAGESFTLSKLTPKTTVGELRKMIEAQKVIPRGVQFQIFRTSLSCELNDDNQTLEAAGIVEDASVSVVFGGNKQQRQQFHIQYTLDLRTGTLPPEAKVIARNSREEAKLTGSVVKEMRAEMTSLMGIIASTMGLEDDDSTSKSKRKSKKQNKKQKSDEAGEDEMADGFDGEHESEGDDFAGADKDRADNDATTDDDEDTEADEDDEADDDADANSAESSDEKLNWETEKDGSSSLVLGPGEYITYTHPGLNSYNWSVVMDICIPKLPEPGKFIALLTCAYPKISETSVSICVDSTGGVGTMGKFSPDEVHEDARNVVKAGEWTRVVMVLGQDGVRRALKTYVNSHLCAVVTNPQFTLYGSNNPMQFHAGGVHLFAAYDVESMPGLKVRFVQHYAQSMTATQVSELQGENIVFSIWKRHEEAKAKGLRSKLSLGDTLPMPVPIWCDGTFHGMFMDPFIESTPLEGGLIASTMDVLHTIFKRALDNQKWWLSCFSQRELDELSRICTMLKTSASLAKKLEESFANEMNTSMFVNALMRKLKRLAVGGSLLLGFGWRGRTSGHAIALVVERTADKFYRLVVSNTGEGVQYHPCTAAESPKMKYKTSIAINNIPKATMLDVFWWTSVTARGSASSFYETFLPLLRKTSLEAVFAESLDDPTLDWRTPQRSGTCYFKSIFEAMYYLMRKSGFTSAQAKFVKFVLRFEAMMMARSDLGYVPEITTSEINVLNTAVEALAYNAAKQSSRMNFNAQQLARVQLLCDRVRSLADTRPCIDRSDLPPPTLNVTTVETATKPFDWRLHPLYDRFLRLQSVEGLAGVAEPDPEFVPIDFLQIPERCRTIDQVIDALQRCEDVCMLLEAQTERLKNASALTLAFVQHVVLESIPAPIPHDPSCMWLGVTARISYAQQVEMLATIERLAVLYMAAYANYPQHPVVRPAVHVVMGTLAMLGDATLRIMPYDTPSLITRHLRGGQGTKHEPYGIDFSLLDHHVRGATLIYPTLAVARARIQAYAKALKVPDKNIFFSWEDIDGAAEESLMDFVKAVLTDKAIQSPASQPYITATQEINAPARHLVDRFIEFKAYMNLVTLFKGSFCTTFGRSGLKRFSFNTFIRIMEAGAGKLTVESGVGPIDFSSCRRAPLFPSVDVPRLTAPDLCKTEFDLLHVPTLPDFADGEGVLKVALNQRDSELLLSFLTAPYIRIPLVLSFFVSEDRIHTLQSTKLQRVLDGALFEPGAFLRPRVTSGTTSLDDNVLVPTTNRSFLATSFGYLLNELIYSPRAVLEATLSLAKSALNLDVGSAESSTVSLVLYIVRTVVRITNYLTFLLEHDRSHHELLSRGPTQVKIHPRNRDILEKGYRALKTLLLGKAFPLIDSWSREVTHKLRIAGAQANELSTLSARLHAHILLLHRNFTRLDGITESTATVLLSSMLFLTTRYVWSTGHTDEQGKGPGYDPYSYRNYRDPRTVSVALADMYSGLHMHDVEVVEVLQHVRRELIRFFRNAEPAVANRILDAAVRVTTGTGSRELTPEEELVAVRNEWGFVGHGRDRGRFAALIELDKEEASAKDGDGSEKVKEDEVKSQTDQAPEKTNTSKQKRQLESERICAEKRPEEPDDYSPVRIPRAADNMRGVEVNLQLAQLSLKSCHLRALDSEYRDIAQRLFNTTDLQCATLSTTANRKLIQLIGLDHVIASWTVDERPCLQSCQRLYNAQDLADQEVWIIPILDPLLTSGIPQFQGLRFFMPTQPLPSDARFCILEGVSQSQGVVYELVVFRDLKVVHVYGILSDCRRFYRSLVKVTDYRTSNMVVTFIPSDIQPAKWAKYMYTDDMSIVARNPTYSISRAAKVPRNFSGTTEVYVDGPQLAGLLPDTLIEEHDFWQDANDCIRGYPRRGASKSCETYLYIELVPGVQPSGFASSRPVSAVVYRKKMTPRQMSIYAASMEEDDDKEDSEDPLANASSANHISPPQEDSEESLRQAASEDLLLVNIGYAPEDHPLFTLMKLLTRLTTLGDILVWVKASSVKSVSDTNSAEFGKTLPSIHLIEFPRLNLSFTARPDKFGVTQLFLVEHPHLYISNVRTPLISQVFRGLPHGILVSTENDEYFALVPNATIYRASYGVFPTEIFPNPVDVRKDRYSRLGSSKTFDVDVQPTPGFPGVIRGRFPFNPMMQTKQTNNKPRRTTVSREDVAGIYIYPLHVSQSFLFTPSLAAAVYMLSLRFATRQYAEVVSLVNSIATDTVYNREEMDHFMGLVQFRRDAHPDSHACRLKIALAVANSGVSLPFSIGAQYSAYLRKLDHVSAQCRLSPEEERLICDTIFQDSILRKITKTTDNLAIRNLVHRALLNPADDAFRFERYSDFTVPMRVTVIKGVLGTKGDGAEDVDDTTDDASGEEGEKLNRNKSDRMLGQRMKIQLSTVTEPSLVLATNNENAILVPQFIPASDVGDFNRDFILEFVRMENNYPVYTISVVEKDSSARKYLAISKVSQAPRRYGSMTWTMGSKRYSMNWVSKPTEDAMFVFLPYNSATYIDQVVKTRRSYIEAMFKGESEARVHYDKSPLYDVLSEDEVDSDDEDSGDDDQDKSDAAMQRRAAGLADGEDEDDMQISKSSDKAPGMVDGDGLGEEETEVEDEDEDEDEDETDQAAEDESGQAPKKFSADVYDMMTKMGETVLEGEGDGFDASRKQELLQKLYQEQDREEGDDPNFVPDGADADPDEPISALVPSAIVAEAGTKKKSKRKTTKMKAKKTKASTQGDKTKSKDSERTRFPRPSWLLYCDKSIMEATLDELKTLTTQTNSYAMTPSGVDGIVTQLNQIAPLYTLERENYKGTTYQFGFVGLYRYFTEPYTLDSVRTLSNAAMFGAILSRDFTDASRKGIMQSIIRIMIMNPHLKYPRLLRTPNDGYSELKYSTEVNGKQPFADLLNSFRKLIATEDARGRVIWPPNTEPNKIRRGVETISVPPLPTAVVYERSLVPRTSQEVCTYMKSVNRSLLSVAVTDLACSKRVLFAPSTWRIPPHPSGTDSTDHVAYQEPNGDVIFPGGFDARVSDTTVAALVDQPLASAISLNRYVVELSHTELGRPDPLSKLPFDVSQHPQARSEIARRMLLRLEDDVQAHAQETLTTKIPRIRGLMESDIKQMLDDASNKRLETGHKILSTISQLVNDLEALRTQDEQYMISAVPYLLGLYNEIALPVSLSSVSPDETAAISKDSADVTLESLRAIPNKDDRALTRTERYEEMLRREAQRNQLDVAAAAKALADETAAGRYAYVLRRCAQQEAPIVFSFLVSTLLSTAAEFDVQKINPYLSDEVVSHGQQVLMCTLLRSNRIGHVSRCIVEAHSLAKKIRSALNVVSMGAGSSSSTALAATILQQAEKLATELLQRRHYVRPLRDAGSDKVLAWELDPRYLVFEFTWNLLLRKKQVDMVNDFINAMTREEADSARKALAEAIEMEAQANTKTGSCVKQLIMGMGKTTVIGPLLALMLADGKRLVAEVVPQALLDAARDILRATFTSVISKRVYTFECDRPMEVTKALAKKLEQAVASRAVVVTTPTALKTLMLKFVELLTVISDKNNMLRSPDAVKHAENIVKIIRLFREGALIMDEVDLILHPLKSELNFPIGPRVDLDAQQDRWNLAVHIIDAVFYTSRGKMSVAFKQSSRAIKILERLKEIAELGYASRALLSRPHLVLLNPQFYHSKMKSIFANWVLLFFEQSSMPTLSRREMLTMLLQGVEKGTPLGDRFEALPERYRKMINLARDWLASFLPHVLQKIDRVTFGLLSAEDLERALAEDPNMPMTRAKLAVPFVGKDVPAKSSEYAHPDIVIGLTILAYRYEGLRWNDFVEVIHGLRTNLAKEMGPYEQRPTNLRYVSWVQEAGGMIRQSAQSRVILEEEDSEDYDEGLNANYVMDVDITRGHNQGKSGTAEGADDIPVVSSLRMLKASNNEQMKALYKLLRYLPELLHYHLTENIFPTYLRHQVVKLSASGQELGSDMLFPQRIGFSGTPSDLLPVDLGRCQYERGADGQVLATMIDPNVVSYEELPDDWSAQSLLLRIARSGNRYHALIDTGALITGLTNKQVAAFLLNNGLEGFDGVVFMDEFDRKMVMLRESRRVVKLSQCGVPIEKRFTFFDQIHTTGIDIPQPIDAVAIQTLGKDMTFRDYAQGAYRMRGIGKGQRIHLYIIPEVNELIRRQIIAAQVGLIEKDVASEVLSEAKEIMGDKQAPSLSTANSESLAPLLIRAASSKVTEISSMLTNDTPKVLLNISAWLTINSMQTERIQFNQLCVQNLSTLWRRHAFNTLLDGVPFKFSSDTGESAGADEVTAEQLEAYTLPEQMSKALDIFREPIASTVSASLPTPVSFVELIEEEIATHNEWLRTSEDTRRAQAVLDTVKDLVSSTFAEFERAKQQYAQAGGSQTIYAAVENGLREGGDVALANSAIPFTRQPSMKRQHSHHASAEEILQDIEEIELVDEEGIGALADHRYQAQKLNIEMVQARVQEQEMTMEVHAEQEIEIEKYVDLAYSRDAEAPVQWYFDSLATPEICNQFYPLSSFVVNEGISLHFPSYLKASVNYFNPRWSGDRRIMNATAVLELVPNATETTKTYAPATLTNFELEMLMDALKLLDDDHDGMIPADRLTAVVSACFHLDNPEHSVVKALFAWAALSKAIGVNALMNRNGRIPDDQFARAAAAAAIGLTQAQAYADSVHVGLVDAAIAVSKGELANVYTLEAVSRMCELQLFLDIEAGRTWILLSLAEAETIRRVMHNRLNRDSLFKDSSAAICLRNVADNFSIIDTWHKLPPATKFQSQMALQTIRFLNSDMHFKKSELVYLLLAFREDSCAARRRFFQDVMACRRRANRKIEKSPLGRIVTTPNTYVLAKLTAKVKSIENALKARGLNAYDAFQLFDVDHNGYLSPAELLGGLDWLGFQETPATLFDLICVYDTDGDFQFSLDEWEATINGDEDEDDSQSGKQDARKSQPDRSPQPAFPFTLPPVEPATFVVPPSMPPVAASPEDVDNARIIPRGKEEFLQKIEEYTRTTEAEAQEYSMRRSLGQIEQEKSAITMEILSRIVGGSLVVVDRKALSVDWVLDASTLPPDVSFVFNSSADKTQTYIFDASVLEKSKSEKEATGAHSLVGMMDFGEGGPMSLGVPFGQAPFGQSPFGQPPFGGMNGAEGDDSTTDAFTGGQFGEEMGFNASTEPDSAMGINLHPSVQDSEANEEEQTFGMGMDDMNAGVMPAFGQPGADFEGDDALDSGEGADFGQGEEEERSEKKKKVPVIPVSPASVCQLWESVPLPTRTTSLEEANEMLEAVSAALDTLSSSQEEKHECKFGYDPSVLSQIRDRKYAVRLGSGASMRFNLPKLGRGTRRAFVQYTVTLAVYFPELPENGYRAIFHTNLQNCVSPLVYVTQQGNLVAHERYGNSQAGVNKNQHTYGYNQPGIELPVPAVAAGVWTPVSIHVDLVRKRLVLFSGADPAIAYWQSHDLTPDSVAALSRSFMIGGSRFADEMETPFYIRNVSVQLTGEVTVEQIQSLHARLVPSADTWTCGSCSSSNTGGRSCKGCGSNRVRLQFKPFACRSCSADCSDPICNRNGFCSFCGSLSLKWCNSCGSQNLPYITNCTRCTEPLGNY